jgi:tRNA-specific adenosine deaminase 3
MATTANARIRDDSEPDAVSDAVLAALRPIVDDERPANLLTEPPLISVVVARVHPRLVSALVAVLAEHLPLRDGLGHVKRVRRLRPRQSAGDGPLDASSGAKLDVLLAPADAWPPASRSTVDALAPFNLDVRLGSVPALAPLTREELISWGDTWPMQFRPARGPKLPPPTPIELRAMLRHLRDVVCLSHDQLLAGHKPAVAAMLVHSETDTVVSQAVDRSERDRRVPAKSIRHAVLECISAASIPQARKNVASAAAAAGDPLPLRPLSVSESLELYLCTGLDVFLSREPCAMCASWFNRVSCYE